MCNIIIRPFHIGGTFIAPKTILKVAAWGDCIIYGNGKMCFSYIMPVEDVGMPQGYLCTHAAKRLANLDASINLRREREFKKCLLKKNPYPIQNLKFETKFATTSMSKVSISTQNLNLMEDVKKDVNRLINSLEKKENVDLSNERDKYEDARKILENLFLK